jgi:hypothetical protein
MSKKRKLFLKFLYYIVVSVILLSLALLCVGIIFYASGYKVNWKAMKIDKTGMLLINSPEDNIRVLIDKKEVTVSKTRSAILASSVYTISMIPGEYDLEIQKDGRLPYDEHIKIEKELVTKINDVLLLPAKIPDDSFLSKKIVSYSFSTDNKKIVYQTDDNKVSTYNIETKEEKTLDEKTFGERIVSYTWDNGNNRIILKINKKEGNFYYILDFNNLSGSFFLQDKMSFLPFFEEAYFSPISSDDLFGISNGTLYKLSVSGSRVDKVVENISHFIQKKDFFYYLDKNDSLVQFDPKGLRTGVILEKFELNSDFDLISINNDNNIFIKNKNILYQIEDKNNLKLIDEDVENILPANNNSQFMYTKGYEIWSYDGGQGKAYMITRFSKKIENIQELFNDKYLVYQQGKDIEVIKKDGKNNQIVRNNIESVRVFDKNKIVIIESQDGQKLFKLIDLSIK